MTAPLYHRYSQDLRKRFGVRVQKVSVDAGFSCPNRDGTVGTGGCSYCVNAAFTPATARRTPGVRAQLLAGAARVARRHPNAGILAYFQPFSNTHGPVEYLRSVYEEALACEGVVGLAVGTRPDCLDGAKIDLLASLAERCYVQLELGLQSARDDTLRRINRGHTVNCFLEAMARCAGRGFDICGHMITGLPGETRADALRTARVMADAGITGIKVHSLHLVRGAPLTKEHEREPFALLSMQEHVGVVCDILERLPWRITIQRLWGTAPASWLVAPAWCLRGHKVEQAITEELRRRNSRQGAFFAKELGFRPTDTRGSPRS